MKLSTAGESHGKGIFGILEGVPSQLAVNVDEINVQLALRQSGYGRGDRQKIEHDQVEILSGVRGGLTLGSPIALAVWNKDYQNWQPYMDPIACDATQKVVTKVRPGHADLSGMIKYNHTDARNVLERASARETAIRVAAGTIARQYLRQLGVEIGGYVRTVCGVEDTAEYSFEQLSSAQIHPLFMLNAQKEREAMALLDSCKQEGDTAGGVIEVRVKGLKCGFGSYTTYDQKLDARLCAALMSVQAIKGVEVGMGFEAGFHRGSEVHDEIFYSEHGYYRKTNRAGGIEGGMSNGEEIVLKAVMKPIPTLMKGLQTVDFATKNSCVAATERSDVCAICAAEVVLESVTALTLAEVVSERLGGDNMQEVISRYNALNVQ